MKKASALADWTPEEIALGKKWVETCKLAAEDLERIKRKEICELHQASLCAKALVGASRNAGLVQEGGRS